MANQEFTLGAAVEADGQLLWEADFGLIDAVLVASGATAHLRRVRLGAAQNVQIRTAIDGVSDASGDGPELNNDWEGHASAIVISAGGETITLPGPDSSDNVFRDDSEAYFWTSPTAIDVQLFVTAYVALTDVEKAATTVTLDDGQSVTPTPTGININSIAARTGEVVRALITVGDDTGGKWFTRIGSESSGSVVGDIIIHDEESGQDLDLDRIWWTANANNDFRLNRDPLGTTFGTQQDFNQYFSSITNLVLYLQVSDGLIEIPLISANWRSIGPHYLNLTPTADQITILNTVSPGDLVNIVIAQSTVSGVDLVRLSGSADSGALSTSAAISVGDRPRNRLAGSASAGVLSTTGAIHVGMPEVLIRLSGSATAGILSTSAAISIGDRPRNRLSGNAVAGASSALAAISIAPLTAETIRLSGSASAGALSTQSAAISVEPAPEGSFFLSARQRVILERMLTYLPPMYGDSEVLRNIYSALAPELDTLFEYLKTQSSQGQEELQKYLDNEVGWGYERLINQAFIISTNHRLDDFRRLYDVQADIPLIELRSRLLFVARLNDLANYISFRQELEIVEGVFIINEDFANYQIFVNISLANEKFIEIVVDRLNKTRPAHIGGTIQFSSFTIDDGFTIDDMKTIDGSAIFNFD